MKRYLRDPIWQFIGVVIALLSLILAFFTLQPLNLPNQFFNGLFPHQDSPLYNADWSGGANGWVGDKTWAVMTNGINHGVLTYDSSSTNYSQTLSQIVAPYQPTTTNYALEVKVNLTLTTQYVTNGSLFGIFVQSATGKFQDGFRCGLRANSSANTGGDPYTAFIEPAPSNTSIEAGVTSFSSTYRVEVRNNNITFLVNGQSILHFTENTSTSGMQMGLIDYGIPLSILSFTVIAL